MPSHLRDRTTRGWSVAGLAIGVLGSVACLRDDPNHCANLEGDATCVQRSGAGFCSRCTAVDGGCVEASPSPSCHVPEPEPEPTGTGETGSTSAGSTSAGTSGAACEDGLDPTCPTEAPYCVDGTCTDCSGNGGDAMCQELDPEHPICNAPAGSCVACLPDDASACPEDTPFCDDALACSGCTEHAQCPDSACDLEAGTCFDPARVWWVDKSTCPGGTGTQADPYCDIASALSNIASDESGVVKIVAAGSAYADGISLTTAAGKRIALIGVDGPRIQGSATVLDVATHRVYVANLSLENASQWGVRCSSYARLWLDDVRVRGTGPGEPSPGAGIEAESCNLHVRRSRIVDNAGNGIVLAEGAALWLQSSVVGNNGTAGADTVGLRVEDAGFQIVYSTIAGNRGDFGLAHGGLYCSLPRELSLRNSIVAGPDGESIFCSPLEVSHSFVDEPLEGEGVVVTDTWDPTWFQNVAQDDFHVRTPERSPFADVAVWQPGDPLRDLDQELGEPTPGAPGFAGADRP